MVKEWDIGFSVLTGNLTEVLSRSNRRFICVGNFLRQKSGGTIALVDFIKLPILIYFEVIIQDFCEDTPKQVIMYPFSHVTAYMYIIPVIFQDYVE